MASCRNSERALQDLADFLDGFIIGLRCLFGGLVGLFDQVGSQSVLAQMAFAAVRAVAEFAVQVDQVMVLAILGTHRVDPASLVGDMPVQGQLQGTFLASVQSGFQAVTETPKDHQGSLLNHRR